MNVLPLVTAFILLFAMGSYSLMSQLRGVLEERTHYLGMLTICRGNATAHQVELFNALEGEEAKKAKNPQKEKELKDTDYESFREKNNPSPHSKLHIHDLITQENPLIKQVATRLIRLLYEHTAFYVEGFEHEVLDQILVVLKEHPEIEAFEECLAYAPSLYKVIKGTHTYRLSTNEGYPPLENFLSLQRLDATAKPIHFTFASRMLLEALFDDPRLVGEISMQERERWDKDHRIHPCTKAELSQLLGKRNKNLSDLEALLYFSTSRKRNNKYLIRDDASSVQMRIYK